MGDLCGFEPNCAYRQRVDSLIQHRIALWDVLKSCERTGSSDAAIQADRAVPNAIADLLQAKPDIAKVFFNGKTARRLFVRQIMPKLNPQQAAKISRRPLPSTSPAHARMRPEQKRRIWQASLGCYLGR